MTIVMRIATIAVLLALAASAYAQPRPPVATPPRPDPDAVYAVPLDDSPSEGPAHAKVTIVMGMEFACPFCRRAWDTIAALRKKYGKDVRVVYKTFIVHKQDATAAALAACAAHKAGKWRAMADGLWTKAFDARDFSERNLLAIGKAAGIDPAVMSADMHGTACKVELARDIAELTRLGQTGTPTFWINGRIVVGAQPIETFEALIETERRKAELEMADSGVALDAYYDAEILAKGLASVK
jgi:protein-disulfide isomerase